MAVGEQDAVDADAVAVQLVAYRGDLAVAQQGFVVPGHLRLELLVHLAPQGGIQQEGGGVVFDQHRHVVGDGLLGPGAARDGEGVAGLGLGGLVQGEAQAGGLTGARQDDQQGEDQGAHVQCPCAGRKGEGSAPPKANGRRPRRRRQRPGVSASMRSAPSGAGSG